MTPEAKKLCDMLEAVDVNDDELNKRAWYYFHQRAFKIGIDRPPKYTRSLDAIKAVEDAELEGWDWERYSDTRYDRHCVHATNTDIKTKHLPTEQRARLHAAIQAIDWKRENE